jgi:hypothetical protein
VVRFIGVHPSSAAWAIRSLKIESNSLHQPLKLAMRAESDRDRAGTGLAARLQAHIRAKVRTDTPLEIRHLR